MATSEGTGSGNAARILQEFPPMPEMPPMPRYPFVHQSEESASLPPLQGDHSSLATGDRPVDPEGAIASSHVGPEPPLHTTANHGPAGNSSAGLENGQANPTELSSSQPAGALNGQLPSQATPQSGTSRAPATSPTVASNGPSPPVPPTSPTANTTPSVPEGNTNQGQEHQQGAGHSGTPAAAGNSSATINPVSDTATELAGSSAGDVTGAPRSDEVGSSRSASWASLH